MRVYGWRGGGDGGGGGWSSGIGVAFEDFCFFLVTFATLRTGK